MKETYTHTHIHTRIHTHEFEQRTSLHMCLMFVVLLDSFEWNLCACIHECVCVCVRVCVLACLFVVLCCVLCLVRFTSLEPSPVWTRRCEGRMPCCLASVCSDSFCAYMCFLMLAMVVTREWDSNEAVRREASRL